MAGWAAKHSCQSWHASLLRWDEHLSGVMEQTEEHNQSEGPRVMWKVRGLAPTSTVLRRNFSQVVEEFDLCSDY